MINAANLLWNFERNASYVRESLAGLTHTDSLVQPPAEGNCINWILGHIVCYRNYAQVVCALPPVVAESVTQRYARGSAAVVDDADDVTSFAMLLTAYNQSHQQLTSYLEAVTTESLQEVVDAAGFTMARGEILTSFMRHESYHAGQFEFLRAWALAQRR